MSPAGRPTAIGLTKRQRDVLLAIVEIVERRGYPPTMRELAEAIGVASPSVAFVHVRALEHKGYLRLGDGPRAITVLKVAS